MNLTLEPAPRTDADQAPGTVPAPEAIDRSCRGPVLALSASAAVWLCVGLLAAGVSSFQLLVPKFLENCEWLTYGRLQPLARALFIYGFAVQAGLGIGLWLMARLGKQTVAAAGLVYLGGAIWNLGVALGGVFILAGGATGFAWFDLPLAAGGLLMIGYVLIALCGLLTFRQRTVRELYPSVWFVLGGLFWFPWLFMTAQFLLLHAPVRGVMQTVVHGWFVSGLFDLWLSALGLATVFYFIPKLAGRPLYSGPTAQLTFWLLAIFGPGCGFASSLPVPRWLPAISNVCRTLLLVAVLSVILNVLRSLPKKNAKPPAVSLLYLMVFGTFAWAVVEVAKWLMSLESLAPLTQFTWLDTGMDAFLLTGFVLAVFLGALTYILPRVAGAEWPEGAWRALHLWGTVTGSLLLLAGYALAGVQQGQMLADASRPFVVSFLASLPGLKTATAGWFFLLAAQIFFLANTALLLRRSLGACGGSTPEKA